MFVKLRPHWQHFVARRVNQKLAARYYGPFWISQRVGTVAYHLDLSTHSQVYPVFHASQLRRVVGVQEAEPELPIHPEIELSEQCIPESILATKSISRGDESVDHWLIRWTTKTEEEDT